MLAVNGAKQIKRGDPRPPMLLSGEVVELL